LWKYLSENGGITFTRWDENFANPEDVTSRLIAGLEPPASYERFNAVFGLGSIPNEYLTASIASLNLTDAFQWHSNDDEEWVPIVDTLTDIEEILEYVPHRFGLMDCSNWKPHNLERTITNMLTNTVTLFDEEEGVDKEKTVVLAMSETDGGYVTSLTVDKVQKAFFYAGMSHRAQLVMGYYNFDFSTGPDNVAEQHIAPSKPLTHFGNMLYLVSNNGNIMHSSNCQNPSVIYRIQQPMQGDTMAILQKPLKSERDEIIADGSALREFKLTLTDRWLNPVKIRCPLVVTIKMKPIKQDIPTYG
jgi:hypothetical protein